MGDATPYSDAELAELRALHEGLCDDTDCASQRLYATIDSLRATLATEREEGERLREAAKRLLDSSSGTLIWDGGHPSQAWRLDERAAQHLLAALSARPSPTEEA